MQVDRKWVVIEPSMTLTGRAEIPSENDAWTNNNFINLARLLKAPRYHILNDQIEPADVYYLISCIDTHIDKEIEFIKKAHARGSKVIVALSTDARFLGGHGLYSFTTGTLYTELCEEADAVTSGMGDCLKMYGFAQKKVVPVGEFVEKQTFETKPFEQRKIDVLGTGHITECELAFYLVFFTMIKKIYPEKRIVYAFRNLPAYDPVFNLMSNKYPQIEFVKGTMFDLLKDTKFYINLETRPRPGRAALEAWYHRVPFMSCNTTYFSKLFPKTSFYSLNFGDLLDSYTNFLQSDYNTLMLESDKIMEYDYAQNVYNRLVQMLDKQS